MSNPRIMYRPAPDATPESEARTLAAAYRFVLQVYEEKKKGAHPGTPDDVRREAQSAHTANAILPHRR